MERKILVQYNWILLTLGLKRFRSKIKGKHSVRSLAALCTQIVTSSSCRRKTVIIGIFITSRNGYWKIVQSIRIISFFPLSIKFSLNIKDKWRSKMQVKIRIETYHSSWTISIRIFIASYRIHVRREIVLNQIKLWTEWDEIKNDLSVVNYSCIGPSECDVILMKSTANKVTSQFKEFVFSENDATNTLLFLLHLIVKIWSRFFKVMEKL